MKDGNMTLEEEIKTLEEWIDELKGEVNFLEWAKEELIVKKNW